MTDDETSDEHNRCPCGRQLTQGWTLCERDSHKLAEDLLEIADRYTRLSAAPSMQPGRYDRTRGASPGSRPPARLDVTTLTDFRSGQTEPTMWQGADGRQHSESTRDTPAVLRAVYGWVEQIAAERGYEHLPDFTVDAAVDWLNRQDDWIARWDGAGELHHHAKHLRNRLRSACGDPNPRPVGRCVHLVDRADIQVYCDAPIFLPEPTAGGSPVVRCSSKHRHEYDYHDLMPLRLINEQEEARGNEQAKQDRTGREAS